MACYSKGNITNNMLCLIVALEYHIKSTNVSEVANVFLPLILSVRNYGAVIFGMMG